MEVPWKWLGGHRQSHTQINFTHVLFIHPVSSIRARLRRWADGAQSLVDHVPTFHKFIVGSLSNLNESARLLVVDLSTFNAVSHAYALIFTPISTQTHFLGFERRSWTCGMRMHHGRPRPTHGPFHRGSFVCKHPFLGEQGFILLSARGLSRKAHAHKLAHCHESIALARVS